MFSISNFSASDDFNNGVVLTRRALRPNELFQVRLERVVTKWAGSIEMGVTTHSPSDLEFPFTMTNVRTGTWMMTGNGVMHNGNTVIEQYGLNLDRLQVIEVRIELFFLNKPKFPFNFSFEMSDL